MSERALEWFPQVLGLVMEDQGSQLSYIILRKGSITTAHSFYSASIHPLAVLDPCSLYTFSLLCSMKQNNLIALHSLFDLDFSGIEFKGCDVTLVLIILFMYCNIGGYGVVHV